MKQYAEITALTKDGRETELHDAADKVVFMHLSQAAFQKVVVKILVAMIAAGDCKEGEIKSHAEKIAKCDIRETMQNVYPLVKVFTAIVAGAIDITEDDFDRLDASKLALLGPFLTKPGLKDKLHDAVQAAKTGTASDIRDLKPKKVKAEKDPDPGKTASIPVGFAATDIGPDDPLVKSKQVLTRFMLDLQKALDSKNESNLETMQSVFGKCFVSACNCLGEDPLDFLADLAADTAKPATATVVETSKQRAAA